jgi:5-methylcytosine-specific restriction endonuclease McrA
MILNASEKSFEVMHRRVLAHLPFAAEIEIRASGKGAGRYTFHENGERAVAIWQVAIGRANQTIVASDDSQARRRIPRDVRQRVWQRYGGRCAECNADTYLEFDHIIPVAKGGGNSETNVQLLCRKCNLSKSDRI